MTEIKQIDRRISEAMPKILRESKKERLSTNEMASKLDRYDICSESYGKVRLHTVREWIPEEYNEIETFQDYDGTPGSQTRFWRLKE